MKKILLLGILTSFAMSAFFVSQTKKRRSVNWLRAFPDNLRKCENVEYPLNLEELSIDKEINSNQEVTLEVSFLPKITGILLIVVIWVFFCDFEIFSQFDDFVIAFESTKKFVYSYSTKIPAYVPKIKVGVKIVFENEKELFSCAAFEFDFNFQLKFAKEFFKLLSR